MIQQLNRFVLEEFAVEGNSMPLNPRLIPSCSRPILDGAMPLITQVVGVDAPTVTSCANCGQCREKDSISHVIDLMYPRKVNWCRLQFATGIILTDHQTGLAADPSTFPGFTFSSIVRSSIERDITYKSNCHYCKHVTNHRYRLALNPDHLPPTLVLNAAVNNDEQHSFWLARKGEGFLKTEVDIMVPSADTS